MSAPRTAPQAAPAANGTGRWQLQPPGGAAKSFLFALTMLLPLGITLAALWHAFDGGPLRLIGDSRGLTLAITLGGVAALTVPMWWILHRALARHHIVLGEHAIEVTTTFHRRALALSELRIDQARVVDLDERTEFKPLLKTAGTSLPGLRSGWFRLRNREKALVATVGGKRVLWLPTRNGYGLLLQPYNPQALLDALRTLATHAARG